MLDEILSAIAGNAIVRMIAKLAPPRKVGEFAAMSLEVLERRNRWLYFGMLLVFIFGFFLPFPFIHVGHGGAGWFAGAVFGLPFSALLIYVSVVWCVLGDRRARELIFYFEVKQGLNIRVFYFLGAPLSLLGIVSFCVFVWG